MIRERGLGQPRTLARAACLALLIGVGDRGISGLAAAPGPVSGVYPHLAMFNDGNECGTGAVVPWAGRLWVVTYSPHQPRGSSDKLYEITPALRQILRPESVGGTPANRMIHRESQQLLIGPYVIDAAAKVRVISPERMPGRLTGNARHLTAPESRVYYATMEEGFYDVDVRSLEVRELYPDANAFPDHAGTLLPGYHGKGLYSGQGRLVYANNGELSPEAQRRPDIASGCLAEWDGQDWRVIRRNQFTEVSGPGGLEGNADPARDPLWSIGWDHRSLILMVLDRGTWHAYRLPKASHCYDGAHGWNTEWPRIRDVGEPELLMTMHGSFWRFPRDFSPHLAGGLLPRSTYLKVIGDFCRWNDRIVFGCDDAAKSEFLNRRKAKGTLAGPGRSQSNLWFVEPAQLDQLGPALGRGAVWFREDVAAGRTSDPFLFAGSQHRALHLTCQEAEPRTFRLEVDRAGDGTWKHLRSVTVLPANGYTWTSFGSEEAGAWVRLTVDRACAQVTAMFDSRAADPRRDPPPPKFAGIAGPEATSWTGGLLHARGAEFRTLRFLARHASGELGCYDLDGELRLRRVEDPEGAAWTRQNVAIPREVLSVDAASVLYVDDRGRWRLPKGDPALDPAGAAGEARVCREVCTERDLFNAHGTFYELPAENAGGFAKIRPIATHNRRIFDYASYRGLLLLSGVIDPAPTTQPHLVRSEDGKCALWVGVVDDLWQLGKPRGSGGPWKDTAVDVGVPSDPYLMTGYDRKSLRLAHGASGTVDMTVQVDLTGDGCWVPYRTFRVEPARSLEHQFPAAFSAYWVRLVAHQACRATAQFAYE